MSKSRLRLIGVALGFFMMAYGAYSSNAPPLIILGLISLGFVFVGIVIYRITRDHILIEQAHQPPPELQMPAARSSPGNRLFVPPPLDK